MCVAMAPQDLAEGSHRGATFEPGRVRPGRVMHCADLHVDSPLRGLAAYEGAPVDEIRASTRRALENAVDAALANDVCAVVMAGDLFDGERHDYGTAMFLNGQFRRLGEAGIEVFVAYGNHDAANQISRRLDPPPNVTVFAHQAAETHERPHLGLAFHGQSYASRDVSTDLAASFPAPVSGLVNVGVLHTALSGHEGPHAAYAPTTLATLEAAGYDYWALGHVHQHMVQRAGSGYVVYPGNTQGRHVRETGPKGVTIFTYGDGGVVDIEHVDTDVVRWSQVEASVDRCTSVSAAIDAVLGAVAEAQTHADGRLLACRVTVAGHGPIFDEIVRRAEEIEADVRDGASAEERVWIERVVFRAQPAMVDAASPEAVQALAAHFDELRDDERRRTALAEVLGPLNRALGRERQALVDVGSMSFDADGVVELLDELEAGLMASLNGVDAHED